MEVSALILVQFMELQFHMQICHACIKRERPLDSLKTETALNFTSNFRSYRGVNTIYLGRKNKSLKAAYRSNRIFISDSYQTHKYTVGRTIVFLKDKRGGEKLSTKL